MYKLWGYSIRNKCKGGTWQSVRDMPTQWQMFVYVCSKAARGNSWSLGLSYLYVLCVLSLVYCVCIYEYVGDNSWSVSLLYALVHYMLVAVGDTWQMRWCWRHDSGGKIRYAVTGPQFIWISMDVIETHLASNSDLKKSILMSPYAMFSRSSASQSLVKETNYY